MREIRLHGSEGGGAETNRSFLPLSRHDPLASLAEKRHLCPLDMHHRLREPRPLDRLAHLHPREEKGVRNEWHCLSVNTLPYIGLRFLDSLVYILCV